jgi:hypothetical protein
MGFDEIKTGLILLPGALLIALVMPLVGRLSNHIGPIWPSLIGLLMIAFFMNSYRTLDINTSVWHVIAPTLIRGIGIALLITPLMVTALNSITKQQVGMASSMMNLIQQVAGSVGIGFLGSILDHRMVFHRSLAASTWSAMTPISQDTLGRVSTRLHDLGLSHAGSMQGAGAVVAGQIFKMTAVSAYEDAFLVGCFIVLGAMVPAFFLPTKATHIPGRPDTIAELD